MRKGEKGKNGKGAGAGQEGDSHGKEEEAHGQHGKGLGPLLSSCPAQMHFPPQSRPISQPRHQNSPQDRALSPPGHCSPHSPLWGHFHPANRFALQITGVKTDFEERGEKVFPQPRTDQTAPHFFKAPNRRGAPAPSWVPRDVPASTHRCSAALQLIPTPSYLGDAAVPPPPRDVGLLTARPSARQEEEEEEENRVCRRPPVRQARAGRRRQGRRAGAGDEWEPGPAPAASGENAAPAKPQAAFAAADFLRGKAPCGRWEPRPLWVKSLLQSRRKASGVGNASAAAAAAAAANRSTLDKKIPFFPQKNFKLSRSPTASPALLSHLSHLRR